MSRSLFCALLLLAVPKLSQASTCEDEGIWGSWGEWSTCPTGTVNPLMDFRKRIRTCIPQPTGCEASDTGHLFGSAVGLYVNDGCNNDNNNTNDNDKHDDNNDNDDYYDYDNYNCHYYHYYNHCNDKLPIQQLRMLQQLLMVMQAPVLIAQQPIPLQLLTLQQLTRAQLQVPRMAAQQMLEHPMQLPPRIHQQRKQRMQHRRTAARQQDQLMQLLPTADRLQAQPMVFASTDGASTAGSTDAGSTAEASTVGASTEGSTDGATSEAASTADTGMTTGAETTAGVTEPTSSNTGGSTVVDESTTVEETTQWATSPGESTAGESATSTGSATGGTDGSGATTADATAATVSYQCGTCDQIPLILLGTINKTYIDAAAVLNRYTGSDGCRVSQYDCRPSAANDTRMVSTIYYDDQLTTISKPAASQRDVFECTTSGWRNQISGKHVTSLSCVYQMATNACNNCSQLIVEKPGEDEGVTTMDHLRGNCSTVAVTCQPIDGVQQANLYINGRSVGLVGSSISRTFTCDSDSDWFDKTTGITIKNISCVLVGASSVTSPLTTEAATTAGDTGATTEASEATTGATDATTGTSDETTGATDATTEASDGTTGFSEDPETATATDELTTGVTTGGTAGTTSETLAASDPTMETKMVTETGGTETATAETEVTTGGTEAGTTVASTEGSTGGETGDTADTTMASTGGETTAATGPTETASSGPDSTTADAASTIGANTEDTAQTGDTTETATETATAEASTGGATDEITTGGTDNTAETTDATTADATTGGSSDETGDTGSTDDTTMAGSTAQTDESTTGGASTGVSDAVSTTGGDTGGTTEASTNAASTGGATGARSTAGSTDETTAGLSDDTTTGAGSGSTTTVAVETTTGAGTDETTAGDSGAETTTGSADETTTGGGESTTASSGDGSTTGGPKGECALCPSVQAAPLSTGMLWEPTFDFSGWYNGMLVLDHYQDAPGACRRIQITCQIQGNNTVGLFLDCTDCMKEQANLVSLNLECADDGNWYYQGEVFDKAMCIAHSFLTTTPAPPTTTTTTTTTPITTTTASPNCGHCGLVDVVFVKQPGYIDGFTSLDRSFAGDCSVMTITCEGVETTSDVTLFAGTTSLAEMSGTITMNATCNAQGQWLLAGTQQDLSSISCAYKPTNTSQCQNCPNILAEPMTDASEFGVGSMNMTGWYDGMLVLDHYYDNPNSCRKVEITCAGKRQDEASLFLNCEGCFESALSSFSMGLTCSENATWMFNSMPFNKAMCTGHTIDNTEPTLPTVQTTTTTTTTATPTGPTCARCARIPVVPTDMTSFNDGATTMLNGFSGNCSTLTIFCQAQAQVALVYKTTYLAYEPNNASLSLDCNSDSQWVLGADTDTPLIIDQISCIYAANPISTGTTTTANPDPATTTTVASNSACTTCPNLEAEYLTGLNAQETNGLLSINHYTVNGCRVVTINCVGTHNAENASIVANLGTFVAINVGQTSLTIPCSSAGKWSYAGVSVANVACMLEVFTNGVTGDPITDPGVSINYTTGSGACQSCSPLKLVQPSTFDPGMLTISSTTGTCSTENIMCESAVSGTGANLLDQAGTVLNSGSMMVNATVTCQADGTWQTSGGQSVSALSCGVGGAVTQSLTTTTLAQIITTAASVTTTTTLSSPVTDDATTLAADCGEAAWASWEAWSVCTDTCGSCGVWQRFRRCVKPADSCKCVGSAYEKERCNTMVCKYPRNESCCAGFVPVGSDSTFTCVATSSLS
ncbi:unnamed protein product, partial [Mesorhabditis spiculigera]